jgi:RNA polymerase sigma-70 factor (ECF subfamily)
MDAAAFDALLVSRRPYLLRLARRHVADRDDAEDVVQQVLIACWGRLAAIRPEQATGYAVRALIRRCASFRREAMARRRVPLPVSLDSLPYESVRTPGIEEEVVTRETWRGYLARTPHLYRQAVVMEGRGYSEEEIAAALGVPVGTVKSRASRGRACLRRQMEGSC